ncbi:hypothetical protein GQ53DRAFT_733899 [Thozetella sp. PMI_491]|nr:hypothetical protein GQ53DRAFT_733899 [Thozetella sp. PMI_491]
MNTEFEERALEIEYEARARALRKKRERARYEKVEYERHPPATKESSSDESENKSAVLKRFVPPSAKSDLNRVKWADFKSLIKQGEDVSFAIDILDGEPVLETDEMDITRLSYSAQLLAASRKGAKTQALKPVQPKVSELPGKVPLPERLRIHSRELVNIINKTDIDHSFSCPLVLLRPFRFLTHYDRQLRDRLKQLESKYVDKDKTPLRHLPAAPSAAGGDAAKTLPAPPQKETGDNDKGQNDGEMDGDREKPKDTQAAEDDRVDEGEAENDQDAGDDSTSRVALDHLKCLVRFMDTDIAQKIKYLSSAECQKVVFSDLWYLFKPGDHLTAVQPLYYAGPTLVTMDEVESQVVVDFEAAFAVEDNIEKEWKPKLDTLVGSTMDEPDTDRCDGDCCMHEATIPHSDAWVEKKRNEEYMDSLLPKSRTELPSVAILPRLIDKTDPTKDLAEEDLVIMSYRVFGFVLRSRKWAQLDLAYLKDELPSDSEKPVVAKEHSDSMASNTAFDRLVLPQGHEDMILGLVDKHFRDKQSAGNATDHSDIVRGKGKGLIILLHGAPGVGKTTTAEGVAEKFRKPLFQITCGDLGTTAKQVEDALDINFALANRWGCILLLDEADVFLSQRTKEDFKRNGLVAVFLRVLEYYAGILFLTTNRVGDFDEAFASRIHISLYYPELSWDKTQKVFSLNLELIRARFAANRRTVEPDDMGIAVFAKEYWDRNPFDHWNGRQIRNACQTALALAEYDANGKKAMGDVDPKKPVQLQVKHFETVAGAYLEFSKYVRDIYGTNAARRAKEAGLRAMWVDSSGNLVGNIGPKGSKRTRFKLAAIGREPVPEQVHVQPQQFHPSRVTTAASYGPQPTLQPDHVPSRYLPHGGDLQRQYPAANLEPPPVSRPQMQVWDEAGQDAVYANQYAAANAARYGRTQARPYEDPGATAGYAGTTYPGEPAGGAYPQSGARANPPVRQPMPQHQPLQQVPPQDQQQWDAHARQAAVDGGRGGYDATAQESQGLPPYERH